MVTKEQNKRTMLVIIIMAYVFFSFLPLLITIIMIKTRIKQKMRKFSIMAYMSFFYFIITTNNHNNKKKTRIQQKMRKISIMTYMSFFDFIITTNNHNNDKNTNKKTHKVRNFSKCQRGTLIHSRELPHNSPLDSHQTRHRKPLPSYKA